MMGWTGFQVALRKKPELARACADLANEWCKALGRATIDVCQPEAEYCCQFTGGFPMKGNEWVSDLWRELGQDLKAYSQKKMKHKVPYHPDGTVHLSHGYSFLSGVFQWYEIGWERGTVHPDLWDGGLDGYPEEVSVEKIIHWHRDHNLYLSTQSKQTLYEKGPLPELVQDIEYWANFTKDFRKFHQGIRPIYFCDPAFVDAAVATSKRCNKL